MRGSSPRGPRPRTTGLRVGLLCPGLLPTGLLRAGLLLLPLLMAPGCTIPRWPVEAAVTSPFGIRWHGIAPRVHRGVDLNVPEGTEVRAMSPGQVRFAGVMRGYGNVVWLDHGREVLTVYGHLSTIHVRTGDRVPYRGIVGLSGQTGDVTGPHLHFEVWRWGRPVDPVPLLGGFPRRR